MKNRPNPEVRRARLRLGLTQVELAQIIGVHYITISRWECGKNHPNMWQSGLCHRLAGAILPTSGPRVAVRLNTHGAIPTLAWVLSHPVRGT